MNFKLLNSGGCDSFEQVDDYTKLCTITICGSFFFPKPLHIFMSSICVMFSYAMSLSSDEFYQQINTGRLFKQFMKLLFWG